MFFLLAVDEEAFPSSSPFNFALSDLAFSSDKLITLLVDPALLWDVAEVEAAVVVKASFLDDDEALLLLLLAPLVLLPSLSFSPSDELDRAAAAEAAGLDRLSGTSDEGRVGDSVNGHHQSGGVKMARRVCECVRC